MAARATITLLLMAAALVLAVVLRLLIGEDGLSVPAGDVLEIRLLRVVIGLVVGAGLSVAGVALQSLLRNPLASPDLLGLASGAGLAMAISALVAGAFPGELAALVGSMGALAVVYLLAQRGGLVEPVSLILVGVIVGIICGAAASLVHHLMPPNARVGSFRWMFGALDETTSWARLAVIGVVTAIGIVMVWIHGRAMDAASMGDDEARSVGVSLSRLRLVLFVVSGVLTAGAVVLAGPVGFVGLVCPHVVRLGAGPAHRPLVIGAVMAGAALVVGADALVRAVSLPSGNLPIGVLTALVGGPVFLVLLRREMRGRQGE